MHITYANVLKVVLNFVQANVTWAAVWKTEACFTGRPHYIQADSGPLHFPCTLTSLGFPSKDIRAGA
jgi:hypothetical protein